MMVALGCTLTLVGWMLFFVLKDFRETLNKFNIVLDDVKGIAEHVNSSTVKLEDMVSSVRLTVDEFQRSISSPVGSVLGVVRFVKDLFSKERGR